MSNLEKFAEAVLYSIQGMELTKDEEQTLVDNLLQALRLGGTAEHMIMADSLTIRQSLFKGRFDTDDLRRIISEAPMTFTALEDWLGVTPAKILRDGVWASVFVTAMLSVEYLEPEIEEPWFPNLALVLLLGIAVGSGILLTVKGGF